ncbi:MAG: cytochrome C oxidase subunit IV family protein [Chloroflexi bacterium]|nr:cytochrome C oxidase subunit IV family protein [Chloroflexota bacterium]
MLQSERIAPNLTCVIACAALVILTLINIGLAMVDLRGWNTLVGLVIAAIQAFISVVFLMHLRWSRPVVRLVGVIALLWLGILIAGTMDDVLTRGWLPIPGK